MPSDELEGQVQRSSRLLCQSREAEVSCRITQHSADSNTSISGSKHSLNQSISRPEEPDSPFVSETPASGLDENSSILLLSLVDPIDPDTISQITSCQIHLSMIYNDWANTLAAEK